MDNLKFEQGKAIVDNLVNKLFQRKVDRDMVLVYAYQRLLDLSDIRTGKELNIAVFKLKTMNTARLMKLATDYDFKRNFEAFEQAVGDMIYKGKKSNYKQHLENILVR